MPFQKNNSWKGLNFFVWKCPLVLYGDMQNSNVVNKLVLENKCLVNKMVRLRENNAFPKHVELNFPLFWCHKSYPRIFQGHFKTSCSATINIIFKILDRKNILFGTKNKFLGWVVSKLQTKEYLHSLFGKMSSRKEVPTNT